MPGEPRGVLLGGLLATAGLLAAGCNNNGDFLTEDRLDRGLVIILPGIEGESELNQNIRRGLIAGGVDRALPIHSWGRPIPLAGVLINQVDFLGNRLSGIGVADMIMNYQDSHPGRPVHIVGHSGGGGVAVFAAEALPEDRKIDGLILLSASISSAYNLRKAASRCREGIVNFYNPDDAGLLGIGTTVLGTVDGTHGPSAGLIGFDRAGKEGHENVYEVKLGGMDSGGDPHASTTQVDFVSLYVARWVLAESWPTGRGVAGLADIPPASADRSDPDKAAAPKDKKEPGPEGKPKAKPDDGTSKEAAKDARDVEKDAEREDVEKKKDPQDKPGETAKEEPRDERGKEAKPPPKARKDKPKPDPKAEEREDRPAGRAKKKPTSRPSDETRKEKENSDVGS